MEAWWGAENCSTLLPVWSYLYWKCWKDFDEKLQLWKKNTLKSFKFQNFLSRTILCFDLLNVLIRKSINTFWGENSSWICFLFSLLVLSARRNLSLIQHTVTALRCQVLKVKVHAHHTSLCTEQYTQWGLNILYIWDRNNCSRNLD